MAIAHSPNDELTKFEEIELIEHIIGQIKKIESFLETDENNQEEIETIYNEIDPFIQKWHKNTNTLPLKDHSSLEETRVTIGRLIAMLDLKKRKSLKKSEPSLDEATNLKSLNKLLEMETEEFVNKYLIESYQTFSHKCKYDKEILISGAMPLMFNKKLKTANLFNFFRAIKYQKNKTAKELFLKKEKFLPSIRMGKILVRYEPGIDDDTIVYFKRLIDNDKSFEIIEMDYRANKATVIDKKNISFKKAYFKEVFARPDYDYITKVNILELSFEDIIYDMLLDEVTDDRIQEIKEKQTRIRNRHALIPVRSGIIS